MPGKTEPIKKLMLRGRLEDAVNLLYKEFKDNKDAEEIYTAYNETAHRKLKKRIRDDEYDISMSDIKTLIYQFFDTVDSSGVKVLYIFSNPKNKNQLSFEDEYDALQVIDPVKAPAVTKSEFFELLLSNKPGFVHLSMHGDWEKGFCFKNEFNDVAYVSPDELFNDFSVFIDNTDVKMEGLFLSCCDSAAHAKKMSARIPYVIGMAGAIPVEVAIEFARGFYKSYAENKDIPKSYNIAVHILDRNQRYNAYKAMPTLFTKN